MCEPEDTIPRLGTLPETDIGDELNGRFQYAPRELATALSVRARMVRSCAIDQLST